MGRSRSRPMLLLAAFVACTAPPDRADPPTGTTSPTGSVDSTAPAPSDTAPGVHTGDTGPDLPTFDCATIPVQVVSVAQIAGAHGYHDLAFTPDGLAIGNGAG